VIEVNEIRGWVDPALEGNLTPSRREGGSKHANKSKICTKSQERSKKKKREERYWNGEQLGGVFEAWKLRQKAGRIKGGGGRKKSPQQKRGSLFTDWRGCSPMGKCV